jgi:hypothetical protein
VFVGHYGVALASKRVSPRLSLGALFLAVQLLDVLFAVFVLAGIESLRIVHGFTAFNPFDLYRMPYTHSLLGALVWSAIAAGVCGVAARRVPARERRIMAAVLGGAVFSHFVLDVPMHTPDLPLSFAQGSPKIGLGLWNHPFASIAAELAVFLAGWLVYVRGALPASRGNRVGTAVFGLVLLLVLLSTPIQPDPTSPRAFAVLALLLYALLAAAAGWIDRGRRARERTTP